MHTQQEASNKDSEGPKKLIGEVSPTVGLREALAQLLDNATGEGVLRVASKDVTGFVGLRSGTITGAFEKKSNTNGLDALAKILATRKGLWGLMDETCVEKVNEEMEIGIKPLLDWRTATGEPLDLELALQRLVKGETAQVVAITEEPATSSESSSAQTRSPARNKASLDHLLRLDMPMEYAAPSEPEVKPKTSIQPETPLAPALQPEAPLEPALKPETQPELSSQPEAEHEAESKQQSDVKKDGSILDVWGGETKVDSPPPVSLSKITLVNTRSPLASPATQEEMSSEEALRVYEESIKRVEEYKQRALESDAQTESQRLQPPPPPQKEAAQDDQRTTMSLPSQTGPQSKPSLPALPLDSRTSGNRSQEEIIKAGNQVFADIEKSLSGSVPKIEANPASGWPQQPQLSTAPGWTQQADQQASQTNNSPIPSKADLNAIPTPKSTGNQSKPDAAAPRPSAAELNAIPTPTPKKTAANELDAIPTPQSQTSSQKMPAQTASQKIPALQPTGGIQKPVKKKKLGGLASVVLTVVLSSTLLIGVVVLANNAMHHFHTKQTIDMAMLFFKEGNYQLASKKLDEYLQENSQDVSALFHRALASAKLGDFDKAASDYDSIIHLRPQSARALIGRGSMRIKLQDYEGAVADTTEALKLHPGDFDALRVRSIAYVHLGEFEKALNDCNTCMQKNPTRGLTEIYSSRGFAYYRMKKFNDSLADYNRAIELSPKDINAHSSRAQVYVTMKEFEKAIADLNKITYWSPRNANAYMLRGQAYRTLKKKDKAISDFDMVITLMPTPENYVTRAEVHLEYNDLKSALADFDHALELQPANKKIEERRKALFAKVLASK